MTIGVYIDNNVWDFLLKHQLDLRVELPKPEFSLGITREAEFEIKSLEHLKPELWAYIKQVMSECNVVTDQIFGFADPSLPTDEQRVGGWDFGRFGSEEEAKLRTALHQRRSERVRKLNPKTRLFKDEADLSLASLSCHSVVLTLDEKAGSLRDAQELGGKVVMLSAFDPHSQKLSDVVRKAFTKP